MAYRDSTRKALGFKSRVYSSYNEPENIVDILNININLVSVEVISGSYINGVRIPTVNCNSRKEMIERPTNLVYSPVRVRMIPSVETALNYQNSKTLNLTRERVN